MPSEGGMLTAKENMVHWEDGIMASQGGTATPEGGIISSEA